jgi:hypothetical protein
VADRLALAPVREYVRHGVWHIWIGFDHILFLLSLLLPAVLVRANRLAGRGHLPRRRARRAEDRHRVHAGAFDHAEPGRAGRGGAAVALVESMIAASVVLAALNNLWPLFHGRRALVAFALRPDPRLRLCQRAADLGLPQGALVLSLVGFNVGVELGQLAIVALFLPLAFLLRGPTASSPRPWPTSCRPRRARASTSPPTCAT